MNQFEYKIEQERKTFIGNKGVESIHLSLIIKCNKNDFAKSVQWAADLLITADLENVKNISINLEALD
jgi:hypothetical protein